MLNQILLWYGQVMPIVALLLILESIWGIVCRAFRGGY